ncbi:MAG: ATP-binding protein [Sphingopyxis sp.]|nr:ATP-binding protein [Sphingopyxis sp.]
MIRITKFFSRNRRSVDEAADDVVEFLPEQIEPAAEIMETSALLAPRHSARAKRPALGFTSSGSSLLQNSQPGFRRNRAYRHAFTPSHPVAELRRLAGRTELLHRVIRSIEDQELHVVLYGDRGIGKTSVLRVVQGLAEEANYLVHYVSCGPSASFTEVFRSLAAKIPLLYDKTIDPTSGEAVGGQTLASRLPEGDYSVSQLTDVLSGIEGVRVLLILDEFDRADVDLFRHSVGELIKNLSDRLIQLRLLIGGVAGNVTDLVSQIPSIRRNIVGIGVPILTDDEIIDMIGIAESYGNVRFDASRASGWWRCPAACPIWSDCWVSMPFCWPLPPMTR